MTPGALSISTTLTGADAVVRVAGEVDLASVDDLTDAVTKAIPPGGSIEVDLTAVAFIDSAGIAGLNRCRRAALGLEASLTIALVRDGEVARLLMWTGLDRVLDLRYVDAAD